MVGVILLNEYSYSGSEDQCNMTDYELWKVNLIPGLMVMNMLDHDPWLTWYWVISYRYDYGSGTILTHADTALIHMSMSGRISRTKFFL